MKKFLFELGVMNQLSLAELESLFGSTVKSLNQHAAIVELPDETQVTDIMQRLGGTIKIAELITELDQNSNHQQINQTIVDYFLSLNQAKIHFALGEIGRDHLERIDLIELKNQLVKAGLKVRYNDGSRKGAKAALLLNCKKLIELILVQNKKALYLGKTVAIQDIDDWTLRDRAKPYADHKKGMLPPKLARMMVNLAVGQEESSSIKIYDPFCGTGTVLMEAAFYDLDLYGSDLDVKAVIGTKENIKWLADTYMMEIKHQIFTQDATRVKLGELGKKMDHIVTEPFLGKQTPKSQELVNIFKGLEKLYLGSFKNWRSLLNDGAKVVIVWPQVEADNHQLFTVNNLLDKLQALGYTKKSRDLIYARPNAIVKREVCVFEYHKIN